MRWVDLKDSFNRFWSEYKHQKSGMLGLFFLLLLIILAIAAPFITSPNIPKEWQTGTAWITNPKNAPPSWENYFSHQSRAPQKVYTIKNINERAYVNGSYRYYVLTFTYDMKYYYPPKDIVITGISSNASSPKDNLDMIITRPPEKGVKYNSIIVAHKYQMTSGGFLQLSYTPVSKSLVFLWLYENGVLKLPMAIPNNLPLDMKLMYISQQITMNNTLYGYSQAADNEDHIR